MRISFKYFISAIYLILPAVSAFPSVYCFTEQTDTLKAAEYFNKGELFLNQTEYDSAYFYFRESGKIFEKAGDWDSFTQCLLKIGKYYILTGDFNSSEVILKKAENTADKYLKNEPVIFKELYHLKGRLLLNQGNYKKSIDNLKKSIDIWMNLIGYADTNLIPVYNDLGTNYYYLGDYEKAVEYYRKGLEIGSNNKTEPGIEMAKIYNNLGIIYRKKGDFEKARDYYQKDLIISEKLLSKDDPELASSFINTGVLYESLGQYDKVIEYYNRAEKILIEKFGKKYYKLGTIYNNKAIVYKNKGEYDKATRYYNFAINIFKENYRSNYYRILKVYHNMGVVHYFIGEYKKALEFFEKSISIGEQYNYPYLSNSFYYCAKCYERLSLVKEAGNYFQLAIDNIIHYFGESHPDLGYQYLDYGSLCIQNGNRGKGLELYQKAYEIYDNVFGLKHPYTANCLARFGDYWLEEKNFEKALEYYQKALIAVVEDFEDRDIYTNPETGKSLSDIQLLNTLKKKADALSIFSDLQKNKADKIKNTGMSLASYDLALKLVEKIRTGYLTRESKLFLTGIENTTFSKTIETAFTLFELTGDKDYKERCFEYAERNKAANLLASLRDAEAMKFGNVPDSVQIRENEIKQDIFLYEDYIYQERENPTPEQEKIDLWNTKLFKLYREQEELITTIENRYPAYYRLKYDTKVLDIVSLQDHLNKKEAVIEYHLAPDRLYIFIVTKNQFEVFKEPIDTIFDKHIEITRNFISSNKFGGNKLLDYETWQNSAFNLYRTAIKPCETLIDEKKLIIIPDGKLAYIPFEVLLSRLPGDKSFNYSSLPYLIKDYTINYSYSATLLFTGIDHNKIPGKKLLAFAPAYEYGDTKNSDVEELCRTYNIRGELLPLLGTKNEVNIISGLVRGDIFSGIKATEKNLKSLQAGYKILHLALHTFIDNENPMYSKLVFTQDGDSTEDGLLNTWEIYNMDLNAEMVVLSACNTGSGKLRRGEGIISLARGFKYAGVRGIVMTLWSVGDDSSADLMGNFYKYLSRNSRKDEALRFAKLDYLKSSLPTEAHPYFWAGYVTIGDAKPVLKKKNGLLKSILAGTIILLLGMVVVYKFYSRFPDSIF